MDRAETKIEKVKITWKGTRRWKEKTFPSVQGMCQAEDGYVTVYEMGGEPELLNTIEKNEVLSLLVAMRASGDKLYVDIRGVERPNNAKGRGVSV